MPGLVRFTCLSARGPTDIISRPISASICFSWYVHLPPPIAFIHLTLHRALNNSRKKTDTMRYQPSFYSAHPISSSLKSSTFLPMAVILTHTRGPPTPTTISPCHPHLPLLPQAQPLPPKMQAPPLSHASPLYHVALKCSLPFSTRLSSPTRAPPAS
jgi:hypothetical protein